MPSALAIVQRFFPKVTHVHDATRHVSVEVTRAETRSKAVRDHRECAMALACRRKFKMDGVVVSRSAAYLVKGTEATRYGVPPSVAREIVAFDRGAAFAPGTYMLWKPTHLLGTKPRPGRSPKRSDRIRPRHVTTDIRASLA